MSEVLGFEGEIVDQQAYLDGTREYAVEAESAPAGAASAWRLTLSVRWPKESDGGMEEGDLSLTDPAGATVYATLVRGVAQSFFDDDTAEDTVALDLSFEVRSGEGDFTGWTGVVHVTGSLAGDVARLTVTPALAPGDV